MEYEVVNTITVRPSLSRELWNSLVTPLAKGMDMRVDDMSFGHSDNRHPLRSRYIPVGSIVHVICWNLDVGGSTNCTLFWDGQEYEAELNRDALKGINKRYQPVLSFKTGKVYKYKDNQPSPLFSESGKLTGIMVNPDDIVLYIAYTAWNTSNGLSGFRFKVIHKDTVGWVGDGKWPTLEELTNGER